MKSTFTTLEPLVKLAATIPGDLAEIGVFDGKMFVQFLPFARAQGKRCHAIDSFCGMAEPTKRDYIGPRPTEYLTGSMNAGGSNGLKVLTHDYSDIVTIWEGFIPEILDRVPNSVRFSFVSVDLDHYRPTLIALEWAWARMSPGAVLISHDWFQDRDILASAAIKEFMEKGAVKCSGEENTYIWFIK